MLSLRRITVVVPASTCLPYKPGYHCSRVSKANTTYVIVSPIFLALLFQCLHVQENIKRTIKIDTQKERKVIRSYFLSRSFFANSYVHKTHHLCPYFTNHFHAKYVITVSPRSRNKSARGLPEKATMAEYLGKEEKQGCVPFLPQQCLFFRMTKVFLDAINLKEKQEIRNQLDRLFFCAQFNFVS